MTAPAKGRFDWVVVSRILAGVPTPIHPSERHATARELVRRGMDKQSVARVCGISGGVLEEVLR